MHELTEHGLAIKAMTAVRNTYKNVDNYVDHIWSLRAERDYNDTRQALYDIKLLTYNKSSLDK